MLACTVRQAPRCCVLPVQLMSSIIFGLFMLMWMVMRLIYFPIWVIWSTRWLTDLWCCAVIQLHHSNTPLSVAHIWERVQPYLHEVGCDSCEVAAMSPLDAC